MKRSWRTRKKKPPRDVYKRQVSINENGELIVTLTDGTELNAGAVPTAAADDSNLKTLVYVSMGTAGISLAGLIGLLAFLLTKRKSLIGK